MTKDYEPGTTKFVPKKSIGLKTPLQSGPVCTCPHCKNVFRAKSRKNAECTFCHKPINGGTR